VDMAPAVQATGIVTTWGTFQLTAVSSGLSHCVPPCGQGAVLRFAGSGWNWALVVARVPENLRLAQFENVYAINLIDVQHDGATGLGG